MPSPAPASEPITPPINPIVTALNATDPDGPTNSLTSEPNGSVPAPVSTPAVNNPADLKLAEPEKQEEKNVSSQIDGIMNNTNPNGSANISSAQPSGEISSTPTSPQDKPTVPEEAKPAEYSPNPVGKKLIEPLPNEANKPSINELLDKEQALEIVTSSNDQPSGEPSPAINSLPTEQAPTSQTPTEPDPNAFDASNIAL
jgi:hypothetical protein